MNSDNLIGHGTYDYLVIILLLLYAFWAGQTKPHRILYILPACISFFFFIEIGPRLTPEKLIPMVFIVSTVLSKGTNYFAVSKSNLVKNINAWISKMWILLIVSSIIGVIYTKYYSNYINSPIINTRLIIQLIGYINIFLIYIIVRKECSKSNGIQILIKAFIVTTTIHCAYGVYQYYAHQFGWPYRGIVYSANSTGFGGFQMGELTFRINGFANEPKRLSYVLGIGILLLLSIKKHFIKKYTSLLFWILVIVHFVCLWLTYSTSIYLSIAIFIGALTIHTLFFNYDKRIIQLLFLGTLVSISFYYYNKVYVEDIYESRVEAQQETKRTEIYALEFISANPEMFLFGLGPGIYNFALAKEYPGETGLLENGTFIVPINSGIITYIYDFGLWGVLLIISPFLRMFSKNIKFSSSTISSLAFPTILFVYCICLTLNPFSTIILLIGAFDGNINLIANLKK